MKRLTFVILALLIVAAALGCSKQQEGEVSDDAAKGQAVATTPQDSMAAATYPIRSDKNPVVTLETDSGKMIVELYRDVAPAHVDSFIARSQDGFYNNTKFFRIIDNFMIQGGDPTGTGTGNARYFLKAEFSKLPHQDGTLSMARAYDPNSASCQFFICLARNRATESLDGKYSVFGQVIKGYDVLHKIGSIPCDPSPNTPGEVSKPQVEVFLRRAYLSDIAGNELK